MPGSKFSLSPDLQYLLVPHPNTDLPGTNTFTFQHTRFLLEFCLSGLLVYKILAQCLINSI